MAVVPVMRPRLPAADRIAPYIQQIDRARIYSNFGPLARQMEARLATLFGEPDGSVCSVSNATVGIALALQAQHPEPGTFCAVPAWTFAATPHAVTQTGLIPYFVDVDPETWALDPEKLTDEIARAPGKVTAVIPVAPFGRPIDVAAWDRFRGRTGIAVVIDAAAAFDALKTGHVPSVVSLHATKVLGLGEGGCIVSKDHELIRDLRARCNFGFFQSRESRVTATNAKLSEYHAAVGMAALDEWDAARQEWMSVASHYMSRLEGCNRVSLQPGFGTDWISATCVVKVADCGTDRVEKGLAEAGIETRRWWGRGAHDHPATRNMPRGSVLVTEKLAQSTIGLPFYRDLSEANVDRIVNQVIGFA